MCLTARPSSLGPVVIQRTPSWPTDDNVGAGAGGGGDVASAADDFKLPDYAPMLKPTPSMVHPQDDRVYTYMDEGKGSGEDASEWPCPRCTMLNPISSTHCEICRCENPVKPIMKAPLGKWICPMCTVHNLDSVNKCGVCDTPAPLQEVQTLDNREFLFHSSEPLVNVVTYVLEDLNMPVGLTPMYTDMLHKLTDFRMLTAGDISVCLHNKTAKERLTRQIDRTFMARLEEIGSDTYVLPINEAIESQIAAEEALANKIAEANKQEMQLRDQLERSYLRSRNAISSLMSQHSNSVRNVQSVFDTDVDKTYKSFVRSLVEFFSITWSRLRAPTDTEFIRRMLPVVNSSEREFQSIVRDLSRESRSSLNIQLGNKCKELQMAGRAPSDVFSVKERAIKAFEVEGNQPEMKDNSSMMQVPMLFLQTLADRIKYNNELVKITSHPEVQNIIAFLEKKAKSKAISSASSNKAGGLGDFISSSSSSSYLSSSAKKTPAKQSSLFPSRFSKAGQGFSAGFDDYLGSDDFSSFSSSSPSSSSSKSADLGRAMEDAVLKQRRVALLSVMIKLGLSAGYLNAEQAHFLSAIRSRLRLSVDDERAALAMNNGVTLVDIDKARTEALKRRTEVQSMTLPSFWAKPLPKTGPVVRTLDPGTTEYVHLKLTLAAGGATVVSVQYIACPEWWQAYQSYCHLLVTREGCSWHAAVNEQTLWYPVRSSLQNDLTAIQTAGFRREIPKLNGTCGEYGNGYEFFYKPERALDYIKTNSASFGNTSSVQLVMAKVALGSSTVGSAGSYPSVRQNHLTYDSTVDRLGMPQRAVIFNDFQAYPLFIITVKPGISS